MTTTSNIHVGLAAWSNHTFVAGERCSNASNAYQCTTPGTSTSAPTGTTSDVDNGGAAHFKWLSAIDYTTIAAWETGIIATLTQPVVGLLWNDGIIQCTLGTILFTIDGHVTSTTNTITLKCAPGESFRDQPQASTPLTADSTKGVLIRGAASGGPTSVSYIWISDDNVIIDGIQFVDPYAAGLSQLFLVNNTGFELRNFILDGYTSNVGARLITIGAAAAFVIANGLCFDRATTNTNPSIYCSSTSTTAGKIVNVTFISAATAPSAVQVAATAANSVVAKNCAAFGQTAPFGTDSAAAGLGVDHCVMSAASLGGFSTDNGSNLFSKTAANQFISATVDFRLKLGADCLNAGVTDATDIPAADDLFYTPRPLGSAWDVGCFEFGLAGVPNVHGRAEQLQPFMVQ